MRKLASIQTIQNLQSIANADSLERCNVLGWNCVVKKGEFQNGQKIVYLEYDSIVPDRPEFEFLRNKQFRIKTIKLRGVVSQGVIVPLSIGGGAFDNLEVGGDVTEALGIVKYEAPERGDPTETKGGFPSFIPKTDETRIQTVPSVLERNKGALVYLMEKLDGTSWTCYFNNGEHGVCSRNLELKDVEGNKHWRIFHESGLAAGLKKLNRNIAIQGELIGTGIQGNKYKLNNKQLKVFRIFDIDKQQRAGLREMLDICTQLDLDTVPILDINIPINWTVPELVTKAGGKSLLADVEREGIVIKSIESIRDEELGDLSFKVISERFLLKNDE